LPLTLLLRSSETAPGEEARAESAESTGSFLGSERGGVPALTFDTGRVVIGRGAGCDVRLPDPSVSHRHATVRANGSEYALVDEKSTNGTFIGGARLAPHTPRPLKNGELLRVGRVWLEVRIDQTPATRDLAVATRDLALALVSQAMRALGQPAETRIQVTRGADAGAALTLQDEGRVYVIGRDASCDLPLADSDVSRAHINVVRRGGTVLLRDLGSKNGVRLGDARLPPDRDVPWRAGTTLLVGGTTIALEEPAATALAELEAAEDEPMGPGDAPPQPPAFWEVLARDTKGQVVAAKGPSSPPARLSVRPPAPAKRQAWSPADVAVVLTALALLGLSVAGLFWLLRT
jgi:pSer/pThr/pTyr-binding forkhead associated (FHA) protein